MKLHFRITALFALLMLNGWVCAQPMSGCYTVGTGATYTSLTNSGGFFSAVNSLGLSGDVIVKISSNLSETGAITATGWAGGYSITIVPNDSISIKYISVNTANLLFNNTSNLTIDGRYSGSSCTYSPGTAKMFVFTSTLTASPIISLRGNCVNFKILSCTFNSENGSSSLTTSGVLNIGTTASHSTGCDDLTIWDCVFEDPGSPYNLNFGIEMRSPSVSGQTMDNLVIKNNRFVNIRGKGIQILASGNGVLSNAVLSNNHFYGVSTATGPGPGVSHAAIEVESGSGYTIRGNFIGGSQPYCQGSPQDYFYSNGTVLATLIRLQGNLLTGAVNMVDSNTITNLEITGSSVPSDAISFSFIRSEAGNNNLGTVYGNTIGDLTSDVTSSTAPIIFDGNNSSYNCRFVYNTSPGTVNIQNNAIGGVRFINSNSTTGGNIYVLYNNVSNGGVISHNQIGRVSGNIVRTDNGNFRAIYSDGETSNLNINSNIISGIMGISNYNGNFNAILTANGSGIPTVSSNTLQNIVIGMSGTSLSPRTELISSSKPGSIIDSNMISNIQVYSSSGSNHFSGILTSLSSGTASISYNTLTNITVGIGSGSVARVLNGIITSGASNHLIAGNRISRLFSLATSNSTIRGIHIGSTGSSISYVHNNVILIDNAGSTGDVSLLGISDNQSAGTMRIFHNTCDIRGNITSGTSNSAAYQRAADCTRALINNVFNNKRSGGSGSHYAINNNTSGGVFSSNYNLLYAEANSANLTRYSGSNRSFSQWQGFGFDANGISSTTVQTYVQFLNGMPASTVGVDAGTTGTGVLIDIDNASRLISTPDMGAYELALSVILPVELIYFSAEVINDEKIELVWETASEKENSCFIVQKTIDGVNYYAFDTIKPASFGSRNPSKNYICYDYNPSEGLSYYRLAQVDNDGSVSYSRNVAVAIRELKENSITIIPNPVRDFVTIQGEPESIADIKLLDASGRLLMSFDIRTSNTFDLSTLRPGVYNVACILKNGKIIAKKIIVASK